MLGEGVAPGVREMSARALPWVTMIPGVDRYARPIHSQAAALQSELRWSTSEALCSAATGSNRWGCRSRDAARRS